ncbi:MAG: single-stranded DNA-binding protein [Candidatus Bathyarchaeota archaeon]|nr:single-stranded DNA-binding protein [Candidatus Bathyarchaeota archaeon]
MSGNMTRIGELRTYSRRVNLVAKVVEMGEAREVSSSSDGQLHRVAEALIGDETGTVLLTLWDENVDRFTVGDVVVVDNGYAGTFRGRLRLNIGRYGMVDKTTTEITEVDTSNNMSEKEFGDSRYRQRGRRF